MVEKKGAGRILFNIFNYSFMLIFALICIIPVWHVIMSSFSNPRLLMSNSGIVWAPLGKPTLDGYKLVMKNQAVWVGYRNTIFYVLWSGIVGTFLTVIAGYLVSRKNFKLANPLMMFILFTMMFSGGLIPSYMVNRALGLINSPLALMIPGIMNAFYITMMKTAFEQLPDSYEESARLDGAGPMTIMFRILAPLLKANIVVILMFNVVMTWNSWYPASIYLPANREAWPLQLYMREILIQNDTARVMTSESAAAASSFTSNLVKYCVTVVATLPILCIYPFAQKYFVTGVQMGGVKG